MQETTPYCFEVMSLHEYAAMAASLGDGLVLVDSVFWRRVRPFFYRPLIPFQVRDPSGPKPNTALFGGVQHAVPFGCPSNSVMEFIMTESAGGYELSELEKKDAWAVRSAAKRFEIRPVTCKTDFDLYGHGVYLDFLQRTRYSYKSERRDPAKFAEWSKVVFACPKSLILGAYEGSQLCAVSISHAVMDTAYYATFFATKSALGRHVSDLMLHNIRMAAKHTPGMRNLFATMRHGVSGPENFYLHRGFKVKSMPAMFRSNPLTSVILRYFFRRQYQQIVGSRLSA